MLGTFPRMRRGVREGEGRIGRFGKKEVLSLKLLGIGGLPNGVMTKKERKFRAQESEAPGKSMKNESRRIGGKLGEIQRTWKSKKTKGEKMKL